MEIKRILIAAAALILTCGCNGGKEEEDTRWKGMDAETRQKYFVNIFAYNMMSTYYLWNEEIKPQLGNWSVTEDPVAKVKALRYKDPSRARLQEIPNPSEWTSPSSIQTPKRNMS